jgi:hypothetical protein
MEAYRPSEHAGQTSGQRRGRQTTVEDQEPFGDRLHDGHDLKGGEIHTETLQGDACRERHSLGIQKGQVQVLELAAEEYSDSEVEVEESAAGEYSCSEVQAEKSSNMYPCV